MLTLIVTMSLHCIVFDIIYYHLFSVFTGSFVCDMPVIVTRNTEVAVKYLGYVH